MRYYQFVKMNNIVKTFCLIVILSVANHTNGQSFTMIFASKGSVMVGTSDKLYEAKELKNFQRNVTSLAVHNGYLYASLKRTSLTDSSIWRVQLDNLDNSEDIGVYNSTWKKFTDLNKFFESILCMVTVNETMYAGRTDGVIWRCPINNPKKCDKLIKFNNNKITGIDYNLVDGKIYASTKNGSLVRCSGAPNSCQEIYKFNHEVTTVKIEFGTLWVGIKHVELQTKKEFGELWKCTESSAGIGCKVFEKFNRNSVVTAIGATDTYMFVNVQGYPFMWFCDPLYMQSFCFRGQKVLRPPAMDTFIIV